LLQKAKCQGSMLAV